MVCTVCGWRISVWDAGGLRYKAASRGKRGLGRCKQCGRWRWFRVERMTEE
ncbi:hypothetical protein [Marimonas arenosa]|uniref:Uncharacterized protein n=1 Tax=Marimonas arenosa TaxID=1795305 RepID=A0AAE3WB78_9RHOB|nr:hypothetical protein [Marimonas arenosa]MDQ2089502.1 hypothetical protein [Marimonas arenosa]